MSGELSGLFLFMLAFSTTAILEGESAVMRDMLLNLLNACCTGKTPACGGVSGCRQLGLRSPVQTGGVK